MSSPESKRESLIIFCMIVVSIFVAGGAVGFLVAGTHLPSPETSSQRGEQEGKEAREYLNGYFKGFFNGSH